MILALWAGVAEKEMLIHWQGVTSSSMEASIVRRRKAGRLYELSYEGLMCDLCERKNLPIANRGNYVFAERVRTEKGEANFVTLKQELTDYYRSIEQKQFGVCWDCIYKQNEFQTKSIQKDYKFNLSLSIILVFISILSSFFIHFSVGIIFLLLAIGSMVRASSDHKEKKRTLEIAIQDCLFKAARNGFSKLYPACFEKINIGIWPKEPSFIIFEKGCWDRLR